MPLFKLDPSFGWREFFTFVAVLLSAVALYQSCSANAPHIVVRDYPGMGWGEGDGNQVVLVATIPISIYNNGGRSITLVALRSSTTFPSLIAVSDGKALTDKKFRYTLHVEPNLAPDQSNTLESVRSWKRLEPGPAPILNLPVSSGPPASVLVGLIAYVYDGYRSEIDYLLVGLDLEFSHGEVVPVRLAFSIPRRRGR